MTETNIINKIYLNDTVTITPVHMATLAFSGGKVIPKSAFSILDGYVNVLEQVEDNLSVFIYQADSTYFEYSADLSFENTTISGKDKFGNPLTNLLNQNVLVFVNGYKLLNSQYEITSDNSILIFNKYINKKKSDIVIYTSQALRSMGDPVEEETWDLTNNCFELADNDASRYIFFMNGELLKREDISYTAPFIKINKKIRYGIDTLEYYRLPSNAVRLSFAAELGYLSYGRVDNYGVAVPEIYDALATFDAHIVRLAIDDVRPGFFIKEENGDGCVVITDRNYETKSVKCFTIRPFSKAEPYAKNEYFVQVPNVRSILSYVSEFDLRNTMFPELLGSFQRTLLNETYDSIQRMKNIRSINKVDSGNINALINFLGMKLNITNMTLEEKHALLEELTNFYKIVGTKTSYNFYNVTSTTSRIMDIEQLFTPIKDVRSGNDPVERYVTFRTAEELGAKYMREYVYPVIDYGDVGTLANSEDSLSNTPRYEGVLEDPERPAVLGGYMATFEYNDVNELVPYMKPVRKNLYVNLPVPGPNKPTIDYGFIEDEATSFIDYGRVDEEIKGKWIEWFVWDRPTNWYPTNHVDVSVEIPPNVDYNVFMDEFKKTFYDIASTVLYIHNIIDVYVFGDDKMWEESRAPNFGIMTSSLYHSTDYVFTNNPTIQPFIY